MRSIVRLLIFFVLVSALCAQSVPACSLIFTPLRKEFRRAKAVFVGKVTQVSGQYLPTEQAKRSIPEYWTEGAWKDINVFSRATFEIKHKWKGEVEGKQEFIAVVRDFCGCPGDPMSEFKEGEEYLVFATGKNFVAVCDADKTGSQTATNKMKRLDDFGFRLWARIYPF